MVRPPWVTQPSTAWAVTSPPSWAPTWGFPSGSPIFFGILGGALGGLILGLSTMRLSGSYLAVITLAFAEVVEMVILNWNDVTNGPLGVRNMSPA